MASPYMWCCCALLFLVMLINYSQLFKFAGKEEKGNHWKLSTKSREHFAKEKPAVRQLGEKEQEDVDGLCKFRENMTG